MEYVTICWKSKTTGYTGKGKTSCSLEVAYAFVKRCKYNLEYWFEWV